MINFAEPVETIDGESVRILCTDRDGIWPVIGLVRNADGGESLGVWDMQGCNCAGQRLRNVLK